VETAAGQLRTAGAADVGRVPVETNRPNRSFCEADEAVAPHSMADAGVVTVVGHLSQSAIDAAPLPEGNAMLPAATER
jgi:hypothetical protein